MKRITSVFISAVLALTLVACGSGGDDGNNSRNPTGPSNPPAPDFSRQSFQNVGRNSNDNKYFVQWYGNLNSMQDLGPVNGGDWNGAMFYLRQYHDGGNRRVSWLTQYANSTPIGKTNVTLIREIESDGRVDFDLLVAPMDRTGKELPRVQVTYPHKGNPDRFQLIPGTLQINGDHRTQGALPSVSSVTTTQRRAEGGLEIPVEERVAPAMKVAIEERQPDGFWRTVWSAR